MFLFIHCLAVEEVACMEHRGLAGVAGHFVRGRWVFEERWVQRRKGDMAKFCGSFSKHRWAHGSANAGLPYFPSMGSMDLPSSRLVVDSWVLINLPRMSRDFPFLVVQSNFWFLCFWVEGMEGVHSLALSFCWWNFSSPFCRWLFFVRQVVCNSWPPRWVLQCRDTRGLGKLLTGKTRIWSISLNADLSLLSLQLKFELI